jgi:hypothetical protein
VACITLTRITLTRHLAVLPAPVWEVAYEGKVIATYAEERGGRLRQVGSSRLDASLRSYADKWGPVRGYPDLDALREDYVSHAKAWEERQVGISH